MSNQDNNNSPRRPPHYLLEEALQSIGMKERIYHPPERRYNQELYRQLSPRMRFQEEMVIFGIEEKDNKRCRNDYFNEIVFKKFLFVSGTSILVEEKGYE